MANELIVKGTALIDAPMEKVWQALTAPEWTRKYMYNCDVESDWHIGSPVLWRGHADGKVYVKGTVADIKPGTFLAYTIIDPNSDIEDKAENYLTVTYALGEENGMTRVNVTQGDFAKVANGEARYKDTTADGWDKLLNTIKELIEKEA
jgi:uncharacterized protein YndB with AHSA1/START domain